MSGEEKIPAQRMIVERRFSTAWDLDWNRDREDLDVDPDDAGRKVGAALAGLLETATGLLREWTTGKRDDAALRALCDDLYDLHEDVDDLRETVDDLADPFVDDEEEESEAGAGEEC